MQVRIHKSGWLTYLTYLSFCSHHPGASCVDIVLQVTQAIMWCDNPGQTTVQGEVGWLISHQEQQTLCLWSPTHRLLKGRQKEKEIKIFTLSLVVNLSPHFYLNGTQQLHIFISFVKRSCGIFMTLYHSSTTLTHIDRENMCDLYFKSLHMW